MLMRLSKIVIVLACLLPLTATAFDWNSVLQGDQRSAQNRARDEYRHPQQTLDFFAVQPQHTVVEVWPGASGWYTEILAPLLREKGKLYAAQFNPQGAVPYYREGVASFKAKLAQRPDIYDRVTVTVLDAPAHTDIAPAGSADRVLTFRNVHNWLKAGTAEQVFAAFYRALKPGGYLGVVEHRAKPDADLQAMIDSGYVTEAKVKALAAGAGFRFVAASPINANPKDDTHHPAGVWTLPPTLRLGAENRAQYLAIGESDRMTLKFIKPL
jgi:predicted methyltransferase